MPLVYYHANHFMNTQRNAATSKNTWIDYADALSVAAEGLFRGAAKFDDTRVDQKGWLSQSILWRLAELRERVLRRNRNAPVRFSEVLKSGEEPIAYKQLSGGKWHTSFGTSAEKQTSDKELVSLALATDSLTSEERMVIYETFLMGVRPETKTPAARRKRDRRIVRGLKKMHSNLVSHGVEEY